VHLCVCIYNELFHHGMLKAPPNPFTLLHVLLLPPPHNVLRIAFMNLFFFCCLLLSNVYFSMAASLT
jgi:hypothetical protein